MSSSSERLVALQAKSLSLALEAVADDLEAAGIQAKASRSQIQTLRTFAAEIEARPEPSDAEAGS